MLYDFVFFLGDTLLAILLEMRDRQGACYDTDMPDGLQQVFDHLGQLWSKIMGQYHGKNGVLAQIFESKMVLTSGYVRESTNKLKLKSNIPTAINGLITKWNFDAIDLDLNSKKVLYDVIK